MTKPAHANTSTLQCRLVHNAQDKCAFVRKNCPDEQAGLFAYLEFYYCSTSRVQPFAFTVIALWLGLLFSTIGIAASDFFCINLSTIANLLGMSESLAGVTFLAFGNGSPDVFSTFAAMSTNSGSLAIGELIGAAGFITTVVAGSMAFVHPFKVAKKSFVRDVSFFIIAATFSMVFLYDGKLYPWEAGFMVGIYIFYVIFVVTWHWWFSRRRRRRDAEAAARAQYVVPGTDAVEFPAYHDEETEPQRTRGANRGRSREDFSALERGGEFDDDDDEDEERKEAREERVLGEINRNMRLNRPRMSSRRMTHNPVRPSLIGVLEFRSVVAGLHKSGNTQSIPLSLRRYSDDPRISGVQPGNASTFSEPRASGAYDVDVEEHSHTQTTGGLLDPGNGPTGRMRAISAPEADALRLATNGSNNRAIPQIDLLGPLAEDQSTSQSVERTRESGNISPQPPSSPTISISPPGSTAGSRAASRAPSQARDASPALLAPPDYFSTAAQPRQANGEHSAHLSPTAKPRDLPNLSIPQSDLGGPSRDGVSPTNGSIHLPSPSASPASRIHGDIVSLDEGASKPLSWWPYSVMPAPGELFSTLFPTLCRWSEKNYWEKFLGVVAAPSVFLLTITLPVVETEAEEGEKDDDIPDLTLPGGSYGTFEAGRSRTNVTIIEPERSPSPDEGHFAHESRSLPHAFAKGIGGHGTAATVAVSTESLHQHAQHHQHHQRPGPHPHNHSRSNSYQAFPSILSPGGPGMMESPEQLPANIQEEPEPIEWNRWLVIVQTFTAPFFIVLIVWAKMDLDDPYKLIRPTLISITCSLAALAIILITTTPTRAPKWRILLCFLGFCVSIAWISSVADEVVGVLKTVGVILNISDAILGLTIFAVGNSLGDLVADITVAKLGYPVMALSACFGGPMLNILLGVGLSGLYLTVKGANEHHDKHPGKKMKYKPYHIEVSKTLMISGATLLVTLVGLLIVVPLRRWKMDRFIGWGLIALWTVSTVGNVIVEIMGLGMSTS
jgi:sodium/potassium/calcium exchanger 6